MKKILGYILAIIGIGAIALSQFPELKSKIPININLDSTALLIAGVVLVILSIFLLKKTSSKKTKKHSEVPIYKGKEIVGYRRH